MSSLHGLISIFRWRLVSIGPGSRRHLAPHCLHEASLATNGGDPDYPVVGDRDPLLVDTIDN